MESVFVQYCESCLATQSVSFSCHAPTLLPLRLTRGVVHVTLGGLVATLVVARTFPFQLLILKKKKSPTSAF